MKLLFAIMEAFDLLPNETMNGFRSNSFEDGSKYEGFYKAGKYDGCGEFYWSNGDKYIGNWKEGLMDGQGNQFIIIQF